MDGARIHDLPPSVALPTVSYSGPPDRDSGHGQVLIKPWPSALPHKSSQNAAQPFGRGVAEGELRPLALVEGRRFHGIPAKWGCRVRVSSMEIEGTMADSWIGCSSSVKTWCCAEIFRRATSVDGFSQSPNAVSRSEEICAPYERPAQVPGERHESCRPEKCTPVQE